MMHIAYRLVLALILCAITVRAYPQGLERIYVETYYVSGLAEADSTHWSPLAPGTVTYRVFADLAPDWKVQAVFGSKRHPFEVTTSTRFFNSPLNDEPRGEITSSEKLTEGMSGIDSWICLGGAGRDMWGVPKHEDTDGSIYKPEKMNGFLMNTSKELEIPLFEADGLLPGRPSALSRVGIELTCLLGRNDIRSLATNNGAWTIIEGVGGATSSNSVLLGQFTTDGEFSFEMNLQLLRPDGTSEQYVAANPIGSEVLHKGLRFNSASSSSTRND